MFSPLRLAALAFVLACGLPLPVTAAGRSHGPTDCPWWRPCGPGETYGGNKRVPQGAFGADARPACEKHDQCYRDAVTGRKICDKAFRDDLRSACENSRHPWACKRAAGLGYVAVRVAGRSSYGTP
ncbi:hypothetical protein [Limnoglobus roseus]|uniref:Phospholipase n=1 Tax=Limnoglobus roseus TaxID=2598579 RepID=A0A5C1A4S1_9BACT|nr:hypothetical protein [Limnoglobus roseus]QEL14099.1 hypothetical protein PX52LOC_00963 [Limnoglobus roseus]